MVLKAKGWPDYEIRMRMYNITDLATFPSPSNVSFAGSIFSVEVVRLDSPIFPIL